VERISGTREWAVAEINCSIGCPHDCRYCYARYDAVKKNGVLTAEQWASCRKNEEENTQYPLYNGRVMFPAAHDIVADNLKDCVRTLWSLFDSGNDVLIVSKPHLNVIQELCKTFEKQKQSILFRFTITARDEEILSFWEPNAPVYSERLASLRFANESGFETSVSVEPILHMSDVISMVRELLPLVSDTIWLGKMNKISSRVDVESPSVEREIDRILHEQQDHKIIQLYSALKNTRKIRWKESIKEVVGISLAGKAGLDM